MTDAIDATYTPAAFPEAADGARPAPYRVADRRRWIVSDEPDTAGLAVLVRAGITNLERDRLQEAHAEIAEDSDDWGDLEPAAREARQAAGDTPRDREWALLAPYVLGWNAVGLTPEGEERPLPPPAEAGPAAFAAVAVPELSWIIKTVLLGYRFTGKAGGFRLPSIATSGPRIAADEG